MQKYCLVVFIFGILACKENKASETQSDPHSFSKPNIASVKHLHLELSLDFEAKQILGKAVYDLAMPHGDTLILDLMNLNILDVLAEDPQSKSTSKLAFTIGKTDPILGQALIIPLQKNTKKIIILYKTSPDATALQWLDKDLTGSKKMPFFFTQSQSIYARSWIPCPDGPGMRFTYDAAVQVPPGMMAAMSADNPQVKNETGIYVFNMNIPIPGYLLALAAGDFEFKALGNRCGVYAEPHMIDKAIYEFQDLPKMVDAAEALYGNYPWVRYDVLVLPPSFPFGGMENPKLTFATPTVIAGDRSLTSLLAHELAHSWSGNLVTNSSWNDFWLNEGFTTYFESRIMESLYGKEFADMISTLGFQDLQKTIHEFGAENPLTKLKLNLKDEDPEEGLSDIAYEKGKLLLRFLEERTGREKWDLFLKAYFEHFKFTSNTSEGFLHFLEEKLVPSGTPLHDTVKQWIYNPGLIDFVPSYSNAKFKEIENQLNQFLDSKETTKLLTEQWSTQEWLLFIRKLPKNSSPDFCKKLDQDLQLSKKTNAEIACAWLEYAIINGYGRPLLPVIEDFLIKIGRRRFLMPLYNAMKNNDLRNEAQSIFQKAQTGYHPISKHSVAKALELKI